MIPAPSTLLGLAWLLASVWVSVLAAALLDWVAGRRPTAGSNLADGVPMWRTVAVIFALLQAGLVTVAVLRA